MLGTGATPPRRQAKLGLVGATVLAVVLGGAACTNRSPDPGASSSTVPASPTVSDVEADAAAKALAAYKGFIATYNIDAATADYRDPELRKYVGDPLLGQVQYDLEQMRRGGLIRTGQLHSAPRVATVSVSGQPKTVTIGDCLDTSGWRTVNKATGKSVDVPGQETRHKIVAEAALYDDGRWLVRKSTLQQGVKC